MKKLIISFLLIILLCNIVIADFEKQIVTNISCTGSLMIRIYGNNTCYIKDCSFTDSVWYCVCSSNTNVKIAAINRDECHATVEYVQKNTGARIVFPTITSWPPDPIPPEPGFFLDVSPLLRISGFLIGGFIVVALIGIIVYFAVKYIKKELEEDERRNQ